MAAKYTLEIHEPGRPGEVWMSIESDTPFMALSVGDIINTMTGFNPGEGKDPVPPDFKNASSELEITKVEHIIWGTNPESIRHKILLSTKEIKNRGDRGEFKVSSFPR